MGSLGDLVLVGSEGGGFAAELAADHAGCEVLLLEEHEVVGGSTAMPGGIVWVPNDRRMDGAGVRDLCDDAWAYFDAVIGDECPRSSDEWCRVFVTAAPWMLKVLDKLGIRFLYCDRYRNYYPDLQGGHTEGRAVESIPLDAPRTWSPPVGGVPLDMEDGS